MSSPPAAQTLSHEAFAALGADSVAYVRAVRSEDIGFLHVEAPLLPPGSLVYVLHAGDGRPLVIAESLEAAVVEAAEHQFETVSVH